MKNTISLAVLALLLALFTGGCKNDNPANPEQVPANMDELKVPASFDFSTAKTVTVTVFTRTPYGEALSGVPVTIYKGDPENGGEAISTVASDQLGTVQATVTIPAYLDQLYLVTSYIGLPSSLPVEVVGSSVTFNYGTLSASPLRQPGVSLLGKEGNTTAYRTLGTWNNSGVPNYLMTPRDRIDQNLLNNINASLPEQRAVTTHHPDYLNGKETNLVLKDSCEVFVTFLHEGAGYLNVLGFYTYKVGSEPTNVAQIESSMTVIFPNASYVGSGGGMVSGDKVKLGNFSANTVIGWFVLSNGYSGGKVTNGNWRLFSNFNLNPESNASLRQHNVFLNDVGENRFILGFEDIARDNAGCDQDFNDCLFSVTANPFTAVVVTNTAKLDSLVDTDKDGIMDSQDEYKTDPARAFNNYAPTKNTFGSLVFEDLWPAKGDYDFNDLVVDYNFNQVTNSQNKVVEVIGKLIVKAIGAGYKNGFGIQFSGVTPDQIESVTGYRLSESYITLASNGVEAGQDRAVIIPFDNAFTILPGTGFVNTVNGQAYLTPDTLTIHVKFRTPLAASVVGNAPFNPFVIINKERRKEVHLMNYAPTALADKSVFGTVDDRSGNGSYYKTAKNLPWALHIPEVFSYPVEKAPILNAYSRFAAWAESGGAVYKDWYKNLSGYRNTKNIYTK